MLLSLILVPALLSPLRLLPATAEFADGARQLLAAAYGWRTECKPIG